MGIGDIVISGYLLIGGFSAGVFVAIMHRKDCDLEPVALLGALIWPLTITALLGYLVAQNIYRDIDEFRNRKKA